MKKVYENNVEYLKKISFDLYRKMEAIETKNASISISKNGEKNIKKDFNNKSIYIHSTYYPNEQARYISEYALTSDSDIIFIIGLGLGYELKNMLDKDKNKRYFIVEPDSEIFKIALENINVEFLFNNGNIYFIQDERYENIIHFLQRLIVNDKTINIKFVVLPSYEIMYKDLIKKLYEYVKKLLNNFTVSLYTNLIFHQRWFQNFIINLKYLKYACPISELKDQFKNIPAVIVAAGPSLNYDLESLSKIYNKAIIATAGTGIAVMEKNKIKTHLAGAVDGSILEENIFRDLEINKETTLIYNSNVYYTVPSMIGKHKFLINVNEMDDFIHDTLSWERFNLYSAASITNVMLYNLCKLGCNPIIILGQDLCYSSGKNYADGIEDIKGTNNASGKLFNNKNYVKVKNKNNEEVFTTTAFLVMKNMMEQCIKNHSEIKFFNGTRNGLSLEGAEDIDFEKYVNDILIKSNDYNIEKIIENVHIKHLEQNSAEKIYSFIKSIKSDNDILIENFSKILVYLETDNKEELKIKYIKNSEKQLNNIPLYKEVIRKTVSDVEYIYKSREYVDKNKQLYSYMLEKCLIMRNAFEYEVMNKLDM